MGFVGIEIVIVLAVVIILAVGAVLLENHNRQMDSYQNVISEFATAMGNGNASKVASLESTRFQNWIRNDTENQNHTAGASPVAVSDSYYTLLKQEGMSITFNAKTLAGDKVETGGYKDGLYTAPKGTIGKSETYVAKNSQNNLPAFTISVVQEEGAWVVDNITSYAYASSPKN